MLYLKTPKAVDALKVESRSTRAARGGWGLPVLALGLRDTDADRSEAGQRPKAARFIYRTHNVNTGRSVPLFH